MGISGVYYFYSQRALPSSLDFSATFIGANSSNGDLVKERRMHIAVASMNPVEYWRAAP